MRPVEEILGEFEKKGYKLKQKRATEERSRSTL